MACGTLELVAAGSRRRCLRRAGALALPADGATPPLGTWTQPPATPPAFWYRLELAPSLVERTRRQAVLRRWRATTSLQREGHVTPRRHSAVADAAWRGAARAWCTMYYVCVATYSTGTTSVAANMFISHTKHKAGRTFNLPVPFPRQHTTAKAERCAVRRKKV